MDSWGRYDLETFIYSLLRSGSRITSVSRLAFG